MKNTPAHYRQGDVLLESVDYLPEGLTEVPRQDGKIVVAIGSSNGNPHYFDEPKSKLLTNVDGDRYLNLVGGRSIKGSFPILDENRLRILVQHPKFGKLAFAHFDAAKTTKGPAEIKVSGKFSLFYHAEHDVHAVRVGTYSHVPQRGFNRGEIRRVQD